MNKQKPDMMKIPAAFLREKNSFILLKKNMYQKHMCVEAGCNNGFTACINACFRMHGKTWFSCYCIWQDLSEKYLQ